MKLYVNIKSSSYGKKQALNNISFESNSGLIAVIGKNGSGKSTLLSCIDGILDFEGEITLDGENIKSMRKREIAKKISMMHQIQNFPHIKVKELVSFGRNPYLQMGQTLSNDDNYLIKKAIANTELSDLQNCYIDRLSGGEAKRAYLAMLLAQNCPIMLLDEATAFMDKDREKQFVTILRNLIETQNKTVIFAMHDLSLAINIADNILILENGHQIYFGNKEALYKTNLIENTFSVKKYECTDENKKNKIFYF